MERLVLAPTCAPANRAKSEMFLFVGLHPNSAKCCLTAAAADMADCLEAPLRRYIMCFRTQAKACLDHCSGCPHARRRRWYVLQDARRGTQRSRSLFHAHASYHSHAQGTPSGTTWPIAPSNMPTATAAQATKAKLSELMKQQRALKDMTDAVAKNATRKSLNDKACHRTLLHTPLPYKCSPGRAISPAARGAWWRWR